MARTVVAPDRVKWKVHRQWAPWRVRFHKRMNLENWLETRGGSGEGGGFSGVAEAVFDSPTGILLALGATAVAMVLFLVIFPIVAIALEIVLLVIVVLAALVGRVLLRRPWTILAVAGEREHAWQVKGWRASRRRIAEAAGALEAGHALPPGAVTTGPEPKPLAQPR